MGANRSAVQLQRRAVTINRERFTATSAHPNCALDSPTSRLVGGPHNLALWGQQTGQTLEAAATFLVNSKGELWIADRRSEHVACARGGPVRAAGEVTFAIDGDEAEVVAATNQFMGFCPRPNCWEAVASVLDEIGLRRPAKFATEFEFRRCQSFGSAKVSAR